jgi:hypothetical protein
MNRYDRQAQNEALLRATNREIERASEELGDDEAREIEVLCECGRGGCRSLIPVTIDEYNRIHGERDRFIVASGHENTEIEHVVERADDYCIVDKFGEAEEIAEST